MIVAKQMVLFQDPYQPLVVVLRIQMGSFLSFGEKPHFLANALEGLLTGMTVASGSAVAKKQSILVAYPCLSLSSRVTTVMISFKSGSW